MIPEEIMMKMRERGNKGRGAMQSESWWQTTTELLVLTDRLCRRSHDLFGVCDLSRNSLPPSLTHFALGGRIWKLSSRLGGGPSFSIILTPWPSNPATRSADQSQRTHVSWVKE